jgi:hypothetical protein
MTDSNFNPKRADHRKLVGFTLRLPYTQLDSVCGSEDIYRTARSLYRCLLSCKDAFPPPLMQEDWAKDVWKEACYRTEVHPSTNLLRQDAQEACLVFCHIWHSFTWIF